MLTRLEPAIAVAGRDNFAALVREDGLDCSGDSNDAGSAVTLALSVEDGRGGYGVADDWRLIRERGSMRGVVGVEGFRRPRELGVPDESRGREGREDLLGGGTGEEVLERPKGLGKGRPEVCPMLEGDLKDIELFRPVDGVR